MFLVKDSLKKEEVSFLYIFIFIYIVYVYDRALVISRSILFFARRNPRAQLRKILMSGLILMYMASPIVKSASEAIDKKVWYREK